MIDGAGVSLKQIVDRAILKPSLLSPLGVRVCVPESRSSGAIRSDRAAAEVGQPSRRRAGM